MSQLSFSVFRTDIELKKVLSLDSVYIETELNIDQNWIITESFQSGSYLSTVTTGPPPRAWCSSSATLTRSKTVESGEHCWGQLGLRKIQTSRGGGLPMEVECWEAEETLNIWRRTLSITWRPKLFNLYIADRNTGYFKINQGAWISKENCFTNKYWKAILLWEAMSSFDEFSKKCGKSAQNIKT